VLVVVSDVSNSGLETLNRLYSLAREMDIQYDKLLLVVNRLRTDKLPAKIDQVMAFTKADGVIALPDDAQIATFAEENRSFLHLPDDNPVLRKIDALVLGLNETR
jgi:CO dehydrogenase nickel-insertion accessory protein CooC1